MKHHHDRFYTAHAPPLHIRDGTKTIWITLVYDITRRAPYTAYTGRNSCNNNTHTTSVQIPKPGKICIRPSGHKRIIIRIAVVGAPVTITILTFIYH